MATDPDIMPVIFPEKGDKIRGEFILTLAGVGGKDILLPENEAIGGPDPESITAVTK
jgi:hypothetical protein